MINSAIKNAMKKNHLTQKRLAQRAGISQGYVSVYLNGKRRPADETERTIKRELGLTEAEMFPERVPVSREEMKSLHTRMTNNGQTCLLIFVEGNEIVVEQNSNGIADCSAMVAALILSFGKSAETILNEALFAAERYGGGEVDE